jgi:prefoldin subunit 5
MSYGEPIDKLAEANKQIVNLQQYLREANEEKEKLNKIIDELREQKVDLQDQANRNKQLLIDVCEYFTSAKDKDMNESELENWVVQVGSKLNIALSNYK